jgi:lysyl-tRNA synthetase class 2
MEAFRTYAGVDLEQALTPAGMIKAVRRKGYSVAKTDTWEVLFNLVYLNDVEPHLGRGKPTIIYDYPAQLAALSKKKKDDPRYAERFEFYIEGLELGDAYSELTDWREQLSRFAVEQKARKILGKTMHPTDMDLIRALKTGMPRAGGIAVGVDRLVMLFADTTDIADTLFFPVSDLFSNRRHH